MEIVKQMTLKLKALVVLILAGIAVGVIAVRKHITDGLKNGELEKAEAELQKAADEKLKEENEKVEAAKQAELAKISEEKAAQDAKVQEKEKTTKKELIDLAKKDKQAFRDLADKRLGIKEKRTPGRKPKK